MAGKGPMETILPFTRYDDTLWPLAEAPILPWGFYCTPKRLPTLLKQLDPAPVFAAFDAVQRHFAYPVFGRHLLVGKFALGVVDGLFDGFYLSGR
jgi:hypothetical protein